MPSHRSLSLARPRHVAGVAFTLTLAAVAACYVPSESASRSEKEDVVAAPLPVLPPSPAPASGIDPSVATTTAGYTQPQKEGGTVIVAYAPAVADKLQAELASAGAVARQSASFPASLQAVQATVGVTSVTPVFAAGTVSQAALGALRTSNTQRTSRALPTTTLPRLDAFFVLHFDTTVSTVDDVMTALAADPNVVSVEPNRFAAVTSSTDPYANLTYDWGLFKVNAGAGWLHSMGSGVTVATIDTGVMAAHLDLAANVLPTGYDYFNNDSNPDDDNAHGTHVAGIIAAVAGNGTGIIGVAPGAKILPVKAFGAQGQGGSTTVLCNSLMYAMTHGADVINNSWAGLGRSPILENVFKTAESLGIVTVCAAGNNNDDASKYFPANIEYGITVAASDNTDTRSSFSNFGVKLDVTAPGGIGSSSYATDILSTVPGFFNGTGTITGSDGSKYAPFAGTSMATPFVSGLAAVLLGEHPTWTVEQIKQAIRKGATDVGTAGFDVNSGYGRIEAGGAIGVATLPPSAALDQPRNGDEVEDTALLDGFALPTLSGAATYTVYAGAGSAPTSWTAVTTAATANVTDGTLGLLNTLNVPDGPTTLRIVTSDTTDAQTAEDRNLVTVNNVYISSPTNGQILSTASFNVIGKVMGNLGFANYTLAWAPGFSATTGFTTITSSTSQKAAGSTLGSWNLAPIPDGQVTLQLVASFSGFATTETVNVILDRHVMAGWPATVQDPQGAKSPKIVDLDHDGHGEVVYGASVFNWDGSVRAGWTNNPGLGRTNAAVANIDSDADLEVLPIEMGSYLYDATLPNDGAPIAKAYKHDKTPIWAYPVVNPNGQGYNNGTPSSVSIGDVDGDSRLEAVFSVYFLYDNPTSATTVFVLDAATGTLLHSFNVAGRSWGSVAIANVDSAGKSDLVIETVDSSGDGIVSAVTGAGVPLTGWPQTFTTLTSGYGDIDPVIGDVDRDCRPDILVGQRLFKHDGTLFTGWPSGYAGWETGALANVDSDAQYEILEGGANMVLSWILKAGGTLESMAGDGNGENGYLLMAGYDNYNRGNPVVADLDGNGKPELLRGSVLVNTTGAPQELYDVDLAGAGNQAAYARFVSTWNGSLNFPIYSTPGVGDINGDGKIDLVLAVNGKIQAWGMGGRYTAANSPWPMFQHDLANTGTGAIASCRVLPPPIPISD